MSTTVELPHSLASEEALIGAVLVNPITLINKAVAKLHPDDFYLVRHRKIWEAFQKLGHYDITPIAVGEITGDLEYLLKLLNLTYSTMYADQYAEIIGSHSRRRKYIEIARKILMQAQKGDVDFASVMADLVSNDPLDGGAEGVEQHMSALVEEVERRGKNPTEIWGMPSGFPDLDQLIGGLHPEQTILLAAPPGVGKSILAMQIAKNVAMRGVPVVIYSFEMSAKRVLMRMLSAESGVPVRAMNTGYMDAHWKQFHSAADKLRKLPIFLSDIYGLTSFEIRADLARMTATKPVGLIVVDYLNKLLDDDGGDDLSNTKLKAQRLQGICREFGVHGILIQSMNKEGMKAAVPHMSAMSGPADVAHEGDNVFLMGKHPESPKRVQLYPAKMRDGDMGQAPITLQWAEGVPMFVTPVKTGQANLPDRFHH